MSARSAVRRVVFRHLALGLTLCAGLAAGLAGGARDAAAQATPLRVMSFNLRYGTADDGPNAWVYRRDLVLGVIRGQGPDILAVQEALRFQLDELRAAFPEYAELGVGRDDGYAAGEYAAILYRGERFGLAESGTFWFSDTPAAAGSVGWGANLPRICTWARFLDRESGRSFYIYNVHWDHESQASRERSARLLAERIASRGYRDPVIVSGDLNAGEDNVAVEQLRRGAGVRAGVRLWDSFRVLEADADSVGTFNAFSGDRSGPKIDYILVSSGFKVESAAIVRTSSGGRYPSDHFPVVASLRF
jgi:endonuclease/exonuclease/phosphatase family metal-dependent hydrolase